MIFVFVLYKQRTHKYCVCTLCAYACTVCICVYCVHLRVLCAFACAVYRGKHGQSIHKANKVCVFYSQMRFLFAEASNLLHVQLCSVIFFCFFFCFAPSLFFGLVFPALLHFVPFFALLHHFFFALLHKSVCRHGNEY